jgi:Domain of unknown function (DUF4173)
MRLPALLAAVAAAAWLPHEPLGLGVPLVAFLVAATVVATGRRSPDLILFGSLALALALVPAVLDAAWVVAVDLVAGCVLAAFAVAGPRLVAVLAPARALDRLPQLIPPTPAGSSSALRGVALGAVVVLPFGALFWTADAAFAEVAGSAPVPSVGSLPGRVAVFALVLLGALGLALATERAFADVSLRAPAVGLAEWAIPLVLLDLLFLAFVAVQVTVLFGGHDHVLETAGLTYAEYARQGFWQLLAAAALTLVVVALAARVATVRHAADRRLLRALLGTLCALTLVTVASALHRLHLYEDAFGLTRPRLAAEAIAWALGGLLVLVLVAGVLGIHRRGLVRLAVAGLALGLLAFSLSNPDGRIAERNVDRWQRTGDLDVAYAHGLSADAVPALARLPEPLRERVLGPLRARLAEPEPWSSANLSRHRARAALSGARARGPFRARSTRG